MKAAVGVGDGAGAGDVEGGASCRGNSCCTMLKKTIHCAVIASGSSLSKS